MASFDMKSGYHHVGIRPEDRNLLGVSWNGSNYVFNVLPFGLSSAPMVFTKLFRPLLQKWREAGISCALYLDDGLVFARSRQVLMDHVRTVRSDLEAAGVVTSPDKCRWEPVQCLTWLGYTIDLKRYRVHISDKRISRLRSLLTDCMSRVSGSKQKRMQLTGNFASLKFVFGPAAQLKARSFHHTLAEMEFCPDRAKRHWSADEWGDLQWWNRELVARNARSLELATAAKTCRIATDASATGAGAVIWNSDGSITRTATNLTPECREASSTYREVYAVLFAIQAFHKQCAGTKTVVQIDNLGAVSVIQKGSPVTGLQQLAREIFEFAEGIGAEIKPVWVPRAENELADAASRIVDRDDWGIRKEVFDFCAHRWGPPTIDVFANSRNAKCPRFLSRYADIGSEGVDAFVASWSRELAWAVPPPALFRDLCGTWSKQKDKLS
ncbi:hypothetical protein L596_020888 [Steinernema carpocapsae]|uniref:Reverse transcriptase domain-containing protein n=1 Tax=Steinernema carpocapsae TaxID=34508 RepID=A0A4U5MUW2_STECR|nr:hypothetical protein L596_020888 [Steinernema carpocapsae]